MLNRNAHTLLVQLHIPYTCTDFLRTLGVMFHSHASSFSSAEQEGSFGPHKNDDMLLVRR